MILIMASNFLSVLERVHSVRCTRSNGTGVGITHYLSQNKYKSLHVQLYQFNLCLINFMLWRSSLKVLSSEMDPAQTRLIP